MNKPIGGRGKKAPYETTHVRIPVDLKSQIEKLIEEYRQNGCVVSENIDPEISNNNSIDYQEFLDSMIERLKAEGLPFSASEKRRYALTLTKNEDDSYRSARNFIQSSRTKKDVAAKILSVIYGTSINDPRLDKEITNSPQD